MTPLSRKASHQKSASYHALSSMSRSCVRHMQLTNKLGPVHRYYICDKKLAALGWMEKTSWEEGLKKTIDWYLEHGFESRWVGDVERALAAHPKAQ